MWASISSREFLDAYFIWRETGKFVANPNFGNRILIRKLKDDTIIVFYDKRAVYVLSRVGIMVFHGWFAPRGFYRFNFKPFCELLKRKKQLTATDLSIAARKYGLSYAMCRKIPHPKQGRQIGFISEKGGWTRRITDDYYSEAERMEILKRIKYE